MVVGGGIMGLGTAFHLSERGYRVTLLEKQKVNLLLVGFACWAPFSSNGFR